MARTRRKPSRSRKLGSAETQEQAELEERNKACRSWVEGYGQDFRTVQSCGKQLARLKGARGGEYSNAVANCAVWLNDIVKRSAATGVGAVASCVRRGYGHGVQQASWPTRKRKRAAATRASEQRHWAHERDRKY